VVWVSIKALVEEGRVTKVIVEGYEFQCDIPLEKWGEAESLLKKLIELGAFRRTGASLLSVMEAFVSSLKPNERKVLEVLLTRDSVCITDLKKQLNMNGRQLAGILANLTKKARKHGLVGSSGSIVETMRIGGEQCYRLGDDFRKLKELISPS
jgi:hypothetical protein